MLRLLGYFFVCLRRRTVILLRHRCIQTWIKIHVHNSWHLPVRRRFIVSFNIKNNYLSFSVLFVWFFFKKKKPYTFRCNFYTVMIYNIHPEVARVSGQWRRVQTVPVSLLTPQISLRRALLLRESKRGAAGRPWDMFLVCPHWRSVQTVFMHMTDFIFHRLLQKIQRWLEKFFLIWLGTSAAMRRRKKVFLSSWQNLRREDGSLLIYQVRHSSNLFNSTVIIYFCDDNDIYYYCILLLQNTDR